MFKAYVISLKEPDKLITSLENKGILARWVEAIDGKKLNNKMIKKNTTLLYSIFGSKNSIAIAMSHMKAWKTFLKTNQQYTIIFEDDVIIENDFAEKLSINIKNTPNDYDLLYLGCFGCKKSPNVLSTIFSFLGEGNVDYRDINDYINKPFIAVALHAYVISRQGAIKLLKLLEGKIYYYLDYCIQNLSSNNLINVYSLNERIAYQSSTDSDISSTASNPHPFLLNKGNRNSQIINEYINKPYIALALHCYMISRKGAIKLLKMLEGKIYYYLDFILQDLYQKNLINVYSLNERIAYQSSTDSEVSSTAINTHPLLLNKTLSKFYIDKKCRASYLTTVSIFRIGDVNFTISSILFIFLGIILAYIFTNKDDSLDVIQATIFFIIISLPDLNEENEKKDLIIKIHFLLFIIPFFIMKNILNNKKLFEEIEINYLIESK